MTCYHTPWKSPKTKLSIHTIHIDFEKCFKNQTVEKTKETYMSLNSLTQKKSGWTAQIAEP